MIFPQRSFWVKWGSVTTLKLACIEKIKPLTGRLLAISLISRHSQFPSSLPPSLTHTSSVFHFPSYRLPLLISSENLSNPEEISCPCSVHIYVYACVCVCVNVCSSQMRFWDPLYYTDISSCWVCS